MQGPTNNTILAPTNEAMEAGRCPLQLEKQFSQTHPLLKWLPGAGFANLAEVYGVPSNITIYLQLAKGAAIDAGVAESPLSTAIGTLVSALLNSHVLTAPINFYANETVNVPSCAFQMNPVLGAVQLSSR